MVIPVHIWAYAFRVWLAAVIALYVAFWLQLGGASSAAVTVAILAQPTRGTRIDGTLARCVTVGSEKYGLVQRAREFTLVPWSDVLERRIGQQVGGIVRDGGVNWSFGRQRSGPSIG